jgi:hypothetical protein
MSARPSSETLESLRVTLQKLEQTTDANGQDIAELKQILLNRIAELEALSAIGPVGMDSPAPSPSELPSLAVVTDEDVIKNSSEATSLEKLD